MEDLKVMEWNINHRQGYSQGVMPEWVASVIRKEKTDIIILTECSSNVPNWETVKKRMFADGEYLVFESFNNQGQQNDVLIAVKKNRFAVEYTKSYYSANPDTPNHLEVKCKTNVGTELTVIGMRIHAYKPTDENDEKKRREFLSVINSVKKDRIVIIGGDFNNYRRKCTTRRWCIDRIDEICNENGFVRYTPDGSSIKENYTVNDPNAFAEDHFIVKGVQAVQLEPYDRSFIDADKNKSVYKWGFDFQLDKGGGNWECIDDPYPDHAILKAKISV